MIRILTTLTAVALFTTTSHAAGTCSKASPDKFKPQADLIALLKGEGLTVSKIKVENGCYEVYAQDKSGKKMNVAYNAETFEKLKAAEAGEAAQ